MGTNETIKASYFCGDVQFEVAGEPTAMGYCHVNPVVTGRRDP